MATVPATEFKAKCLELMDRVAERRESFVITKRAMPTKCDACRIDTGNWEIRARR